MKLLKNYIIFLYVPRINDILWIRQFNLTFKQYKAQIELFKDSTNFDVEHFMANDFIGFNIKAVKV